MKTIDCPLQTNARVLGDHPAMICGGKIFNYRDLNKNVWSVSDYLTELGIRPKDRVAIFAANSDPL